MLFHGTPHAQLMAIIDTMHPVSIDYGTEIIVQARSHATLPDAMPAAERPSAAASTPPRASSALPAGWAAAPTPFPHLILFATSPPSSSNPIHTHT
jgi:hypothetical protein